MIFAVLAQQVERFHGKEEVAGSTPANGLILLRFEDSFCCKLEGTFYSQIVSTIGILPGWRNWQTHRT